MGILAENFDTYIMESYQNKMLDLIGYDNYEKYYIRTYTDGSTVDLFRDQLKTISYSGNVKNHCDVVFKRNLNKFLFKKPNKINKEIYKNEYINTENYIVLRKK